MTKLKLFLSGAVIAALAGTALWAQPLANRNLSGNEVIVAAQGGPGGPSIFIPTSQLRGGSNPVTTASTTGTLSPALANTTGLLVSTAASTSLTVQLPPTPWDGQAFVWVNGSAGAFTAGTISTTDGSTIVGSTAAGTLAAGSSIQYVYVLATNSWYKAR
jgi:hypothetical protein